MSEAGDRQLRLALGMRGGVSLAVWIGGACAEIDELRRVTLEDEPNAFWRERLTESGRYTSVVVDVLAGASAGGLNGVLFGLAIRNDFRMDDLFEVWRKVADIDRLRRDQSPWLSVLEGDQEFLEVLRDRLKELLERAPGAAEPPAPHQVIDLQLSATLVEPIERPRPSPSDETLRERRSAASFHFHYRPNTRHGRDDFVAPPSGTGPNLDRLALAARATASFPVAFEPAVVRSSRPHEVGESPPSGAGWFVDCRGNFSESHGPSEGRTDMMDPEDFIVCDGGVVDNIPLGKALDAVLRAPADRPTKRVLVYLHPTGPTGSARVALGHPGGPTGDQIARRGVQAVATGVLAAKIESESIGGDIEQIERHNRRVELARGIREQVLSSLTVAGGLTTPADRAVETAWQALPGYRAQRSSADASATARLLADPLGELGEDPFPLPTPPNTDDVWRSPTAQWAKEAREALDAVLTADMYERLKDRTPADVVLTGLGPLRRGCLHLIEYCHDLEDRGAVVSGETKKELYAALERVLDAERGAKISLAIAAGPESARVMPAGAPTGPLASAGDIGAWWSSAAERSIDASPVLAGTGDEPTVPDILAGSLAELRDARTPPPEPPEPPEQRESLLHAVLAGTQTDGTLLDPLLALGVLEILCFPEHLVGSAGSKVDFRRISAAVDTPLAADFERLRRATVELDPALQLDPDAAPDTLAPNVKLAGNELASFSAFLETRWRENDWLWGRLDAVPVLVDLLLAEAEDQTPEKIGARSSRFRELVEERQRQIIADHFAYLRSQGRCPCQQTEGDRCRCNGDDTQAMRAYRVGLETLTTPGSANLVESVDGLMAVAANVLHENLPGPARVVSGPVGRLGRWVVKRLATPRGWPGEDQAKRLGPVRGKSGGRGARSPRRAWAVASSRVANKAKPIVLWALCLGAGLVVAALAWGAAASKSTVLIGLGAGLVIGLSLSVALVFLVARKPPKVG